jgi:hypothetical protein
MIDVPERCHFCGSAEVRLSRIGIAIGMSGSDYSFCGDCLRSNSAEKFWFNFFRTLGLGYPNTEDEGDDGGK